MAYDCKILADSLNPQGCRLTTFEITYPRMVLAELNTHRVFSRNAASSRAIPTKKLLERIRTDPVIPVWWGKNQAGMQAKEELQGREKDLAIKGWLKARDQAVASAEYLAYDLNAHKQIVNRLVEPWMWVTNILTATEFNNFFALRCDEDAQPEIKKIADLMFDEYFVLSKPKQLKAGEWHMPLVPDADELAQVMSVEDIVQVATGRAARVSYLTHDGKRDPSADISLHDALLKSGHMSPFEHCAAAQDNKEWIGNFQGFKQYRKGLLNEADFSKHNDKLEKMIQTRQLAYINGEW